MRPSLPSLLASAASHGRGSLTRASPSALLPPVPLYRRILRAHRKHLPREMRVLGDQYVKAEFRAHRDVDNPVHLVGFLAEWQSYAQQIEGDNWEGDKFDQAKLHKMNEEQIRQMYDLMQAIQNRHGEGESNS